MFSDFEDIKKVLRSELQNGVYLQHTCRSKCLEPRESYKYLPFRKDDFKRAREARSSKFDLENLDQVDHILNVKNLAMS